MILTTIMVGISMTAFVVSTVYIFTRGPTPRYPYNDDEFMDHH